jgi:hypothetical protein
MRVRGDAHRVTKEVVGCPVRRRDVELDVCFMCAAFQDLVSDNDEKLIYCRPAVLPMEFEGYPIVL